MHSGVLMTTPAVTVSMNNNYEQFTDFREAEATC